MKFFSLITKISKDLINYLRENFEINLITVFKIFASIVFIYQSILLTIDYLKYETVIDLKLVPQYEHSFPAISFCLKSKFGSFRIESGKSANFTISDRFGEIFCEIDELKNCRAFTRFFESMTPFGFECITLFSELDELIKNSFGIRVSTDIEWNTGKKFNLLLHHHIIPPHMHTNMIEVGVYEISIVEYFSIKEGLLPYPYETNCYDYQKYSDSYRSREDCIVKYYQRKEFDQFGCNRKWLYYNPENMTGVKICSKLFKTNYTLTNDKLSLDKICPKHCDNQYIDIRGKGIGSVLKGTEKVLRLISNIREHISITHLPKMNFIEYFSSIGGLFSMWFGISLFHLILYLWAKLTDFIEEFTQINNISGIIRSKLIHWNEIYRLKNKFKILIILIFSIFTIYQISEVIIGYLEYGTLTRVQMNQKQFNQRMIFGLMPHYMNLDKLLEIYPELKRENRFFQSENLKNKQIKDLYILSILTKYLEKLIANSRFEELSEVTNTKYMIKSCLIFKGKNSVDCSNTHNGIFLNMNHRISFMVSPIYNNRSKNVFEDETCYEEKLDRIELKLNTSGIAYILLGNCETSFFSSEIIMLKQNSRTQIEVSSYSVKRFELENNCKLDDKYSSDSCFLDCYFQKSNQTYGCLNIFRISLYIDFRLHFISKGYVMCDQSMRILMNDSNFGIKFVDECHKNCPKKCKKTYFNNNIIIHEFSKVSNDTILEFFPTKSPHFEYSETLSVDFNQLIYNCGGILGLWFGLSPLSIDDLITI
jgi:hypothetical protein